MAKARRGFAVMDRERQREIARKGGKAAHEKGTAHRWSEAEAKEAGRKGGAASHRNGHRTGSGMKETEESTTETPVDERVTEESHVKEPNPKDSESTPS